VLDKKYSEIETNTLFEMYLAAEGEEREKIAEALYQQGKRLCMHKYWSRYQSIPLDIADELYHEALIEALEKGNPKQNFKSLLVVCFVNDARDWFRRQRYREPKPLPYDAIDIKEEMFWEWLADPIPAPAKLEFRERLAQTLDCVMTLGTHTERSARRLRGP
jgi:RNA polymerase sigma factor (sigma-70 family)